MIFLEEGREGGLPGFLYSDDLVQCDLSEEDLRVMMGQFLEVCRRRGLKVNAGKSKVMVLNGEEGLECKVHVDRIRLEHVLEFKYLGCVLDESGTDEESGRWRVGGGLQVSLGLWLMIGLCSLSVLGSCIKHCLSLFLCMAVRQSYGWRRRDLE